LRGVCRKENFTATHDSVTQSIRMAKRCGVTCPPSTASTAPSESPSRSDTPGTSRNTRSPARGSRHFGRASAPTIPQRDHTIRVLNRFGLKEGTVRVRYRNKSRRGGRGSWRLFLTRSGHRMCIAAQANVQLPRAQPTGNRYARSATGSPRRRWPTRFRGW
jgi:hypothetical protein